MNYPVALRFATEGSSKEDFKREKAGITLHQWAWAAITNITDWVA